MTSIQKFVARQRELLDLELQAEKEEESTAISDSGRKGGSTNEPIEKRPSHVLGRLEASDISVGLYGRTVVQLTPLSSSDIPDEEGAAAAKQNKNPSHLLPAHRFTVGNEVEIRARGNQQKNNSISGVICAVTEASISVAISEDKQASSKPSSNKPKGNKGKNSKQQEADNDNDSDETNILDSSPLSVVPRSSIEVHKRLVAALDRLENTARITPLPVLSFGPSLLPPNRRQRTVFQRNSHNILVSIQI